MPLVLLNKPHHTLCQFTDPDGRSTLADFVKTKNVYPAGRLDYDSEGLLLLTDDGPLQARISQPASKLPKRYWVQVEGRPSADQLQSLRNGVQLKDGPARALHVAEIPAPNGLWERVPPVRERKTVPDVWLDISIDEGRNRQVRRITAAAGLPTLRLIRHGIGPWQLDDLQPGDYRELDNQQAWQLLTAEKWIRPH